MSQVTVEDFEQLFKKLEDKIPFLDASGLISSLRESLNEYNNLEEEKGNDELIMIPSRYEDKKVEFLMLRILKSNYIDGIMQTQYIAKEFEEINGVDEIQLVNSDEKTVDEINLRNLVNLESDIKELESFYSVLAAELLDGSYGEYLN